MRRRSLLTSFLVGLALLCAVACSLNPQPEPPAVDYAASGAGGKKGTGGSTGSLGGTTSASGGAGGAQWLDASADALVVPDGGEKDDADPCDFADADADADCMPDGSDGAAIDAPDDTANDDALGSDVTTDS